MTVKKRIKNTPPALGKWEQPPLIAKQESTHAAHHGIPRHDPYAWLEERENPRVKKVLQRENDYVEGFFQQHNAALRKELFSEMKQRWKENEVSFPTRDGNFWYYSRQLPGAEYSIYCRRPYSEEKSINTDFMEELTRFWRDHPLGDLPTYDDEEVFLDPNLLAKELGADALELGDVEMSPDHSKVAVMVDLTNGKEVYTLFVLQVRNVNYMKWLKEDAPRSWSQPAMKGLGREESIYHLLDRTDILPPSVGGSPTTASNYNKMRSRLRCSDTKKRAFFSPNTKSSDANFTNVIAPPSHCVLHRIEQFEMGPDVVWATNTTLLYCGLDEAMRPYQLIFHDLQTLPDDNPLASIVCYEERDEAFWLGSLCVSADHLYFMFDVSSSEASEWYICPMTPCASPPGGTETLTPLGRKTELVGVPLVAQEAEGIVPEDCGSRPLAPVSCFCSRRVHDEAGKPMEYDADHHDGLLGPALGCWIVRSNHGGRTNFTLWCIPDTNPDDRGSHLMPHGRPDEWQALLEYDPQIKVEGVECLRHYLIISVRRHGTATALFCPVELVRSWWMRSTAAPLRFDELLDISELMKHVLLSSSLADEGAAQSSSLGTARVYDVATWMEKNNARGDGPDGANTETAASLAPSVSSAFWLGGDGEVVISPLPLTVECFTDGVSFESLRSRVSLSHLLRPHELYEMRYVLNGDEAEALYGKLEIRCVRKEVVKGDYDAARYDGATVWVPSDYFSTPVEHCEAVPLPRASPRAAIPVYLLWRKELFHRGENPLMMHVYGSYGDCCETDFASERISLMDRGFLWGTAAVRGGGEFGVPWRDEGRQGQRGATVNDFLSVAKYLQDTGICAPGKLVSWGGSAGGFVVCRAMTAAPQLFHAVIGSSPFVDCLSTLLRADLPLTVTEWEEFGNPVENEEAYRRIRGLSPVDTIPEPSPTLILPHIFLETSWNDTRVGYWESLKLVAHLREWMSLSTQPETNTRILHHCNFGTGHAGGMGRYEQLHELSAEYAFAINIVSFPSYFIDKK